MRFDQCGIDCTTDCGHCKGDPIGAMQEERDKALRAQEKDRAEIHRLHGVLDRAADDAEQVVSGLRAERDTLAAQLARAEPVLQAVAAYVKEHGEFQRMVRRQHSAGRLPKPSRFTLLDAWDAYQATPADP